MGKLWEKLGSRGSLCYESFRRHGAAAWIRISLKRWCSCCSAASHGRSHLFVPFTIHLRNFRGEVSEKSFLVVRTSLSLAITLRKEGRVGLLGETPNGLSASKTLNESHLLVYTTLVCQVSSYTPASLGCTILSMKLTANANRQSHFDECHQLFIPTHNVTLAIARCASAIQIVCQLELIVETQPQLQPALLSLFAIISQHFTNSTVLVVVLNRLRRRCT